MRLVVIDFETFFSDEFTLKKLSTEAYIRDPRFEAHGAAIKWSKNHNAKWYDEKELRYVLKEEDWSDVFLVAHHGQFDHAISAWHYDVHPKMLGCTLAMARLLLGNHIGVSLDSVRAQFGLQAKRTPYSLFVGRHWNEIEPDHQRLVAEGCEDEVESIFKLFHILGKDFPKSQYEVVDILLRMFVEPRLVGDVDEFARIWESENSRKVNIMTELGVTEADLQSSDKFAELLRQQGVEPEMKDGKNGDIFAFAKTDSFMQELLESEDDIVASLALARLGVKSTIQQTRAATLGWMARRGNLVAYMRPYGAKTTRPSGGDKSNMLNMKKVDPDMPKADQMTVKQGICAPEGFYLAPIDSSQGECRILNMVAGQWDVIEKFRNGDDPYVNVASHFYGFPVNKKDHPTERQVGKIIELQAGYGSGGPKILATLRNKAGIILPPEKGIEARDAYRQTHLAVTELWKEGNRMLSRLAGGPPLKWGPVEIRDRRMWLPNGCPLIYDTIQYFNDPESGDGYWRVKTRKGWEKLYGAKLVENMCQALHWNAVSDVMVRIARMGYRTLNVPYDELLVMIPKDGREQEHLERCKAEMRRPPAWLPDIPWDCEGKLQERYAK